MSTLEDRQQTIRDRVAELQRTKPGTTFVQAWAALERSEPHLFSESDYPATPMIDFVQSLSSELRAKLAKPPPIYRYVDTASSPLKKSVDVSGLRKKLGLPSKIEARKPKDDDDTEVMLVMAADGSVAGLELHKKTQRLLDKTDGPLHRDIARHLVLDANPKLADEYEHQDDLARNQMLIKSKIAQMRAVNSKLSFRDAWERLQRTDPQLFEELPEA